MATSSLEVYGVRGPPRPAHLSPNTTYGLWIISDHVKRSAVLMPRITWWCCGQVALTTYPTLIEVGLLLLSAVNTRDPRSQSGQLRPVDKPLGIGREPGLKFREPCNTHPSLGLTPCSSIFSMTRSRHQKVADVWTLTLPGSMPIPHPPINTIGWSHTNVL